MDLGQPHGVVAEVFRRAHLGHRLVEGLRVGYAGRRLELGEEAELHRQVGNPNSDVMRAPACSALIASLDGRSVNRLAESRMRGSRVRSPALLMNTPAIPITPSTPRSLPTS